MKKNLQGEAPSWLAVIVAGPVLGPVFLAIGLNNYRYSATEGLLWSAAGIALFALGLTTALFKIIRKK